MEKLGEGGAPLKTVPRRAVCCPVLLLLAQVRAAPDSSALAQAYRVTAREIGPFRRRCWGKTGHCGITNTAGLSHLYHDF